MRLEGRGRARWQSFKVSRFQSNGREVFADWKLRKGRNESNIWNINEMGTL